MIEKIQEQLLLYFNKSNWKEYIDNLKFGDCRKIACIVSQMCGKENCKVIEIDQKYSKEAKKLLNDGGEMFGNHYLNVINNIWYDFSKGCNTINGIYLIGNNKNDDIYNVQLNDYQKKHIIRFFNRYPNYYGFKMKIKYINILKGKI